MAGAGGPLSAGGGAGDDVGRPALQARVVADDLDPVAALRVGRAGAAAQRPGAPRAGGGGPLSAGGGAGDDVGRPALQARVVADDLDPVAALRVGRQVAAAQRPGVPRLGGQPDRTTTSRPWYFIDSAISWTTSVPRRPDVMISVRLKPSSSASGPMISWAPGPMRARGNGWNSLMGNGWRISSTFRAGSFRCRRGSRRRGR